jgi:hypothetical protein
MTIYETLKKDRRISNDFDYKRAKAELRSLAKTYNICHGIGHAQKLQLFADAVDEYEKRTMTCFLENVEHTRCEALGDASGYLS